MTAGKNKGFHYLENLGGNTDLRTYVWDLVGRLLEADPIIVCKREKDRKRREMELTGGQRK
jgi:hypothetical protein